MRGVHSRSIPNSIRYHSKEKEHRHRSDLVIHVADVSNGERTRFLCHFVSLRLHRTNVSAVSTRTVNEEGREREKEYLLNVKMVVRGEEHCK